MAVLGKAADTVGGPPLVVCQVLAEEVGEAGDLTEGFFGCDPRVGEVRIALPAGQ
ncbi:hypothetical protein AB0G73_18835 [Streptomyces sp. NPDC020719]|uniref:hypothetical protein n=1 Tax=Streptomyces sp. NPDC020719 TaxID=3154896 RepID=UPI0033DA795A